MEQIYILVNDKKQVVNDIKTLSRGFGDISTMRKQIKDYVISIGHKEWLNKEFMTESVTNLLKHKFSEVLDNSAMQMRFIKQNSIADKQFELILWDKMGI